MEQIYREYPLRAGRVVVRGRTAKRDITTVLRADYALFYKVNIPLAAIEAKDNNHAMGAGMAQAINYAKLLDVPFCFSSNGDGFVFAMPPWLTACWNATSPSKNSPRPASCGPSIARGRAGRPRSARSPNLTMRQARHHSN